MSGEGILVKERLEIVIVLGLFVGGDDGGDGGAGRGIMVNKISSGT